MTKRANKTIGTSQGEPVTEDDIERLSAEAEQGYALPNLRRRGRPTMGSSPAEVVPIRLDPDLRKAVSERAKRDATTASAVIRDAIRAYLRGEETCGDTHGRDAA